MERLPPLLIDCTMAKLARWLRLAGFDTALDSGPPDASRLGQMSDAQQRIILTRSKDVFQKIGPGRCVLIGFNVPMAQARQVMQRFKIQRHALKPLSRCAQCNVMLTVQPKDAALGLVPDYVWQHHERFFRCPQCERIYWPGTHADRTKSLIDRWFL
jgi:uncharacterized protein with PIN domain